MSDESIHETGAWLGGVLLIATFCVGVAIGYLLAFVR